MGFETSDDAGIYKLNAETAIIMTTDFITPPVDDPFVFGQIAAANAISDVYAMGGTPLACLNLIAFPSGKLPQETLHKIIEGGLSKITEAGAVLAGGHSIDDDEPKYGLSVTGTVHPDRIWTNGTSSTQRRRRPSRPSRLHTRSCKRAHISSKLFRSMMPSYKILLRRRCRRKPRRGRPW